ncbi:hypothetical protein KR059_008856 [Drosophila kikkawai]|nr:hypothetical protein KR059_008856 [Drosophila kikkawai]
MATAVKTAITVMLIIQITLSNTQSPNLKFLNKLFENIKKVNPVETLVILQHLQDRNCELQDWNRREIPTLRINQLAKIEVRRNFNTQGLGLVCIGKDSDFSLIDNMAEVFDGMRQERIILWMQKEVTQEVLQRISHKIKLYEYLQVLILEVSIDQGEILSAHRFLAVPNSQIVQVGKMAAFPRIVVDFTGRTANVLPDYDALRPVYAQLADNLSTPFQWLQKNHQIMLFARKYNLKLKVISSSKSNVSPDILMSSRMTSTKMDLKYLNPYDLSTLMVVVPCSRLRSISSILKQLDIKSNLFYILPVYVTFVAVETIILLVTHRINGRAYQLTNLNPLLNLRAFRAILGLSFPISRRANPSLRQLFLAISVFGLIFSNFFSAKLTALLTKHSHYPQVRNFDDLRASDLSVVINNGIRTYIETEIDPKFFNETITRVHWVTLAEKTRLFLSLNDSYAYVIISDNWKVFESYQKSFGRKVLCDSKDLTIIHGMPKMHVLKKNSIYDWPLSNFLLRVRESGLHKHWINRTPYIFHKIFNATLSIKPKQMEVPLRIADLNWLWLLLGCGYGLATFVFIIEIMLKGLKKNKIGPKRSENVLVV